MTEKTTADIAQEIKDSPEKDAFLQMIKVLTQIEENTRPKV